MIYLLLLIKTNYISMTQCHDTYDNMT